MKKIFLLIFSAILLNACATTSETESAPASSIASTREYHIQQKITLLNYGEGVPEKQNLWVALIHDVAPYQEVFSRKISPNGYTLFVDEYGNEYAEFDFSAHPPGTEITIEIEYELAVNEIIYELGDCEGELISEYTQAETHIESANSQIMAIAENLSKHKKTACEEVRAFYDYVGDELFYFYNQNNWGAQAALGAMGADCTEYSSLMMALSRAEKIPARYFEGLLSLRESTAQIAEKEHAWLDVYLPGSGWVAMDPTMGRFANERDIYFAHYTPDHIIVTMGRTPSALRGASYLTHLYWPGNSTKIKISALDWVIELQKK
ncbi:MAG: transglutaminase family protein [Anaerolineae bacterium]|jgi:transglutaminase-like putative cysteine protease|nr:transglutaminase family protein [Anaerolineae bacterium]MBT7069432.1 transglutaminase family protein [Anaerolineae bacterium]MBT7324365.1 transglutaminase family protein [Anaerolineae bacterium]